MSSRHIQANQARAVHPFRFSDPASSVPKRPSGAARQPRGPCNGRQYRPKRRPSDRRSNGTSAVWDRNAHARDTIGGKTHRTRLARNQGKPCDPRSPQQPGRYCSWSASCATVLGLARLSSLVGGFAEAGGGWMSQKHGTGRNSMGGGGGGEGDGEWKRERRWRGGGGEEGEEGRRAAW